MDKFQIGSQWKTRGGWRAVIVGINNFNDENVYAFNACLDLDGYGFKVIRYTSVGDVYMTQCDNNEHDLIEPWKDIVLHEGWINVYNFPDKGGIETGQGFYEEKSEADKMSHASTGKASPHIIACIAIKFTEGEGL